MVTWPRHPTHRRPMGALDRLRLAVTLTLLAVIPVTLGVVEVHDYVTHAATGQPCEQDMDCRSRECLTVSDYQPSSMWSSMGLLAPEQAQELDRRWDEQFDPLAPSRDGLRTVGVARRYCTSLCENDTDCPAGMSCAETVGYQPSLLGGGQQDKLWISGQGQTALRCVHR